MKTISLALLLGLAACHHDAPPAAPQEPPPQAAKAPPADDSQLKQVTSDQQVSPNLALGGDVMQACGIKAPAASANPNFDYDKDELTPEDRTVLDQLATCLTTGPLKGKAISLIGRADPRGTEEYNLGLGSRRAESVSTYLAHLGVTQPQLGVTTRGALDATGTDEAGWSKDRRVDIQLKTS